MNTFYIAILSIALSVAAQFSLKAGMSDTVVKDILNNPFALGTVITVITNKFVVGGFLLYGLGAIVWLGVLSKWDVSKAYPLVGLGFVFTLLVGLTQGEQVGPARAAGVLLIASGVYLVSWS